jgi:hypothetical protein
MSDEVSSLRLSTGGITPLVDHALQKHELRVALVHAPSSGEQATELMEGLRTKGANVMLVKVSIILRALCFSDWLAGELGGILRWMAQHIHRER